MATRVNRKNNWARAQAQAANGRRRTKRRRGKRTLHFALLILFLLAAGAVLSFTVFFKIEAVPVVGTDKYDPGDIAKASGIVIGENLLRIDKDEIQKKLLAQFPYIESVEVRRKLPPAVELSITQAVPVAAISQGEQVVLINREGKVLERGILLVPEEIPLIKGIDATGKQPGAIVADSDAALEKLGMLQRLMDAMDQSGFTQVTNVDLTDRLNIRIIYENRIILELGSEGDLPYKLEFVQFALQNKLGPEERGTLDATLAHKNPPWMIFSPSDGGEGISITSEEDKPTAVLSAETDEPGGGEEGTPPTG